MLTNQKVYIVIVIAYLWNDTSEQIHSFSIHKTTHDHDFDYKIKQETYQFHTPVLMILSRYFSLVFELKGWV